MNYSYNELNLKWYSCEGENNNFWNHELQKHASCIRDYVLPKMDSTEYFKETLNLNYTVEKLFSVPIHYLQLDDFEKKRDLLTKKIVE